VHANAERVAAALQAAGSGSRVRELDDSARTATDAAAALGVPVGAIVKSLVFTADDDPLLVLASGDHRVDTSLVAAAVGAATVRQADAVIVRQATGFDVGGVAPIGHPSALATVIDRHLEGFEPLWAAAGTPDTVFPTTYGELTRLTAATPADIAATG
jgi:prolyl-tRNA editing enzyme YbaK/EbsC (Cys-tRNA(Pro) deacylase)